MAITVKDLFQYNPNFDQKDIVRLTGKSNYKRTDTVDLARLAALNDKDLSIWAAEKEGESFVRNITDENMQAQIEQASGVGNVDKNTQNIPAYIPMDKSVFDYQRPQMA